MNFDFRNEAFAMISLMSNRLTSAAAPSLREFAGLTINEMRIILFVHSGTISTAADAVRFIAIDQAAISRSVQRLVERGLVIQTPDRQHAKRIILSLTDQGKAYARALWRWNRAREDKVLSVLSSAELAFFLDLLARVIANVDAAATVKPEVAWMDE